MERGCVWGISKQQWCATRMVRVCSACARRCEAWAWAWGGEGVGDDGYACRGWKEANGAERLVAVRRGAQGQRGATVP